ADGAYVLEDVFPGTRRIIASDLVANEQTKTQVTVSDGQTQQADLLFVDELELQGGLSGQVLDEAGQPVSGATLHLSGGYWSTRWAHAATSDADGYYHFPNLEPGVYGIHAYSGLSGAVGFGEIRFAGDTDFVTIQFKSGFIRGRTTVRESDGTLQGVKSQITYRTTKVHTSWGLVVIDEDFSYTETDGDGYFEIEALHGPYELYFYNPFHETGFRTISGHLGAIEPDHQVEFTQNGSIAGTVFLEDGVTPAAGADVELRGGGFNDYDLTADEQGRFNFEFIPPGRYHVTATLDHGVVYRTERVYAQMKRHGAEMDIEVVLQRQGRVEGTVVDAGGIAVPGAVVELRERGFPFRHLVRNADDNGQYAFDNIFEGELTLRAKAPSLGGLGGHIAVELVDEEQVLDTEIVLEGAGDVRGRVFNPATGEPVPNARVAIFRDGYHLYFVDSAQTDSDGYFEIRGLKLRDYGLRVFDPATGRRGVSPVFGLGHHGEVFEQDVTLEVRGTVEGYLYDPDAGDQGVPGATLQLHSKGIKWFKTYSSTGIDGEYSFEGIPEGDFDVRTFRNRRSAHGSGRIEEEDQVVRLDLYLARQSALSFRVLAARTGADDPGETLLENISSRVWETTGNEGLVGASLDNPASFESLRPRRSHKLVAKEINGDRRVSYHFRLQPGEDRDLDLRVKAIGSVTVTTQSSTGAVLSGVDVELRNAHSHVNGVGPDDSIFRLGLNRTHFGTSDAAGVVHFPDIWEGRYDVRIEDPVSGLRGRGSGKLYWDGEEKSLVVKLQPSGSVTGTVYLSDGVTPAAGAVVALDAEERSWLVQYAEADGTFRFDDIPLGDYRLIAQEDEGLGSYELTASLDADLEVDSHTIVLDDADPFVVDLVPPFGSQNVDRSSDVVVTFSEPMRSCGSSCASKVYIQEISSNLRPSVQRLWSGDRTVLTLRPNSPLKNSTGYKLVVTTGLEDDARRPLAAKVVSSFYTADTVPPKVIDFRPQDGAVEVPVAGSIEVTFNEPLDLDSLSGAFEVFDLTAGQGLTVTTQTSLDDRRVVLTPVVDFSPDRQIEVRISGVTDGAGNAMGSFTSSFWTPDETPPVISWEAPSAGQVFSAGDTVDIRAQVNDNRGVESVTLRLGDWSRTMTGEPFEWQIPAPVASQAGPVE
ncbi:MAG: carboxypeptidase regulatory-like domain-containing protein, partial [Acidobacteriota bacterium]